jgi:hypothetical protein
MKENKILTRDLLNAQTGRIAWSELARYFARGLVVCVEKGEDLVAVAETLIDDNSSEVDGMYRKGALRRALDEDAIRWQAENTEFWAVVVAPWVLVQEA